MLACKEEECEASLKAEREQVLTPPSSLPRWKKFLCFRRARARGHTRTRRRKQKLPGKLQRDASSRAQRGGGGETLAVSVVCFQFGFIKNPQTNHPKNPTPNSSSELIGSKKKPLFITCVSSPCPSPQSLPLTKHLQDGNLLGCLFSTQVDKHIDRRVNAICCFREKWGPQTKWNCWSQARGSAPFPLQQTRARTSVHTCAPLPSNF